MLFALILRIECEKVTFFLEEVLVNLFLYK